MRRERRGTAASRRRAAAAALAFGLLALAATPARGGVLPASHAVADHGPAHDAGNGVSGTSPYPVQVTLDSMSPVLPKAGDTLTVKGQLRDTTRRPISGARLGVRVDGVPRAVEDRQEAGPLAPGQKRSFTLRIPVGDLGAVNTGIHSFGVTLTTVDGELTGLGTTRLPWTPDGVDGDPLDVAVLWPVTDQPHAEAVSLGWGDAAQPVFRDDALAGSFGAGGRLRQVVAAADGLPVTWTVDPALLDEARAMSGGYRVADVRDAGDPQRSHPGAGQAVATAWLGALRTAVRGQDVVALPYADPDIATLAHGGARGLVSAPARSGAPDGALTAVLRQSVRWGAPAAASALGVRVRGDIVWPYAGALDAGITGVAATMGASVFIASGSGLSTGSSLSRVSLGGGTSALVGDPAATAALSGPSDAAADLLTARQHLLRALLRARLAVDGLAGGAGGGADGTSDGGGGAAAGDADGAGDRGSADGTSEGAEGGDGGAAFEARAGAGGLLIVPPRRMTGGMASVLTSVLEAARDAGWLRLVGLDGLGSGAAGDLTVAGVAKAPAVRPASHERVNEAAREGEGTALPEGELGAAQEAEAQVAQGEEGGSVAVREGRAGSYPQGLRAGELSADDLSAVAAIQPDLGNLSRVLSDPARTTDVVHRAMLRAVSTGWRVAAEGGDVADQKSYTGGVRAYVDNSIASVHLLPKHGTITLAGDAASIPVTVSNGLQQPLAGLELKIVSSAANRVTVARPATLVEAPPAANHTEQVKVRAHANGPVEITAQLYTTSNHRPWGDPVTFRVRVSRLSPLVVGVIASGAFLVLLAGAFQARRARHRAGGPGAPPTRPRG